MLDEEVLHSAQGWEEYTKFVKLRTLGSMDVDTYNIRESVMKRRRRSICAPERYRQSKDLFVERMDGYETIWDLARDKAYPLIHSTVWDDEPMNKRSKRPRYPEPEIYSWSRDRWEEESKSIDLLAGKNDVKIVSTELKQEMEALMLKMYPPKKEGGEDDDELASDEEWATDEEVDWEDDDWEEGDEDWEEGGEYEEGRGGDGGGGEEGTVLVEGWAETLDEQGRVYYINEATGESSWDIPVAEVVAVEEKGGGGGGGEEWDGWQTLQDEQGNWYYFNPVTGESQWA